jgi:hypothetical protein
MAAGCLIFIGFQKRAKIEQMLEKVPPLLIVTSMVGVMFLPVSAAVPATIGIVVLSAILIACLKQGTAAYQFFTLKKVVFVGLISYSLYLWHWSVLSISRWTIGIHWWSAPFQLALMLGLATFSYTKIEMPTRKDRWRISRKAAIAVGGSILACAAFFVLLIKRNAYKITLTNNPVLTSTWWHDRDMKYIEYCHVQGAFSRSIMMKCLGSSSIRNKPIGYLLGDSHARNYLAAARNAFPGYTIKYLTMGFGCAFLPDSMIDDSSRSGLQCSDYVKETSEYIYKSARPGDIVFIGQALLDSYYLSRTSPEYFTQIEAFAKRLEGKDVPVVLFDGTFPPGANPELCTKELWRPFPDMKHCQKPAWTARVGFSRFDDMASELAGRSQNIFYAPLRTGLCDKKICGQYTLSGTPIWHDNGHITDAASGELAGLLRSQLRKGGFFEYLELAQKNKPE